VTITEGTDVSQPAVLDMRRLWVGGVATAVVAALIVLVGVFIARGILGISVLAPATAGDLGTSATAVYAVFAAACALLGTGVLNLLLLGAPRPLAFFTWITALADVLAVTTPFSQGAPLSSKVFTALINLIVGVAVISLLNGVARSALRPARPSADRVRSPDGEPLGTGPVPPGGA
jgi:hypothetical protein